MTDAATGDISTCLWFDGQAEETARFYVSVFPVGRLGRLGAEGAVVALVVDCGDQAELAHRPLANAGS